ncbi:MAG TPA: alpha/beta fold hydrolase [Roseiflexaceae bacterium]|nr:alpha/beta fold hydrolase [Roseiflexaceae bacterium]
MKAALGVLILHGFTSSRATVEALVPQAEALGLPWRLPQLRGHWTSPADLVGVTYDDMLDDATTALGDLRGETESVAVIGLSVGGVLALDLTLRQSGVDSLVVLAPALRYANPLARFAPLVARIMKTANNEPALAFADSSLVGRAGNYTTFPCATFVTVERAGRRVEGALPGITTPLLIVGARSDRVVRPEVAQIVHDRVGSVEKELVWFERSGHELLLDCEAEAVADRVGQFLRQRLESVKSHEGEQRIIDRG